MNFFRRLVYNFYPPFIIYVNVVNVYLVTMTNVNLTAHPAMPFIWSCKSIPNVHRSKLSE